MAAIKLNWEYCECGCHGHEVSVGNLYFWVLNDLRGGATDYHLHSGHGWIGPKIGDYASWDDVNRAVMDLIRVQLLEIVKAVGPLDEDEPKPAKPRRMNKNGTPMPLNRFDREDPVDIEYMPGPKKTECKKHHVVDCLKCGVSNRRDAMHTTKAGKGTVARLQKRK